MFLFTNSTKIIIKRSTLKGFYFFYASQNLQTVEFTTRIRGFRLLNVTQLSFKIRHFELYCHCFLIYVLL